MLPEPLLSSRMTSIIDLGHLRLSCPKAALSLALSNSAQILASSKQIDCSFTNGPTASSNHPSWIDAPSGLHLLLDISFDGNLVLSPDDIQDRLVTALRDAPLWTQFHLRPSLTIDTPTSDSSGASSHCIVIHLFYLSTDEAESKPSLHQLGVGVPLSDIKPPEYVKHETLEHVMLRMHLYPDHAPRVGLRSDSAFAKYSGLDQDCSGCDQSDACDAYIDAVLLLIDAAMRLSISDLLPKAIPGIVVKEIISFRRLEDVCPAVWRQGYLSNITSRAVFLPTISHAISHLPRDGLQSRTLESKLETLGHKHAGPPLHHDTQRHLGLNPQTVVSAKLWCALQNRLRAPPSKQTISPMYNSTTKIRHAPSAAARIGILPSARTPNNVKSAMPLQCLGYPALLDRTIMAPLDHPNGWHFSAPLDIARNDNTAQHENFDLLRSAQDELLFADAEVMACADNESVFQEEWVGTTDSDIELDYETDSDLLSVG